MESRFSSLQSRPSTTFKKQAKYDNCPCNNRAVQASPRKVHTLHSGSFCNPNKQENKQATNQLANRPTNQPTQQMHKHASKPASQQARKRASKQAASKEDKKQKEQQANTQESFVFLQVPLSLNIEVQAPGASQKTVKSAGVGYPQFA